MSEFATGLSRLVNFDQFSSPLLLNTNEEWIPQWTKHLDSHPAGFVRKPASVTTCT
jgi:hypothetical protein